MNAGEKINYCLRNPIRAFDVTTNGLRWELFPGWVCGMDIFIDDILYDDCNWEQIVDSLGLYDEESEEFIEYADCTPEQWYSIYDLFIQHMHYWFEVWEEQDDEEDHNTYLGVLDSTMKQHFLQNLAEYRRVRCL